jgi:hypothetical protein
MTLATLAQLRTTYTDVPTDTILFTHDKVQLAYSPTTGKCYRYAHASHNPAHQFAKWRLIKAGTGKSIYTIVTINGANRLLHRIVAQHFLNNGNPLADIDTIDHRKHASGTHAQDALDNLRIVTHREQQQNLRFTSSRFSGVCWDKKIGKWHTQISLNGSRLSLGYFKDELEAAKVYIETCITHNLPHRVALEKFLDNGGSL